MQEKLLSVIIPVYKVEAYLAQCIESICKQTYKNLEILCIDDGSPDRSGAICDAYAKKDARIRVFHVKNGGVSRARNIGLNAMRGEYMTLLDSDDYILPDCFATVVPIMEQNHLELCSFGSFREEEHAHQGTGKISLSLEDEHDARLKDCLTHEGTLGWGSVMRAELWQDIRYPEGRIFEDSVVAYQLFDRLQRMGSIDKAFYFYRKNPQGICSSSVFSSKARFDYILAGEDRLAYAKKKHMGEQEARTALLKAVLSAYYGGG